MIQPPRVIEGERFDKPLVMEGAIEAEPERYIAEKPYELTKFEFGVLRKINRSEFWFSITAGATAGIAIAIAGKALAALIAKQNPVLESWELWAVGAGFIGSLALRLIPTKDDVARQKLEDVIEGHFATNLPRRLHLTTNKDAK